MQSIQVDREQMHQAMRKLGALGHREPQSDSMNIAIKEMATRIANATASQTGGKVTILFEGANEG